jgi:hypothetical protein
MRKGVAGVRLVAAVVAAGAVCVPAAGAKGPDVARVCGAARCVTLRGERAVWPLLAWQYDGPFALLSAPRPAAFYSIRLHGPSGVDRTVIYLPGRHVVRLSQSRTPPYDRGIGPYWRTLPASADASFRRAVRGLAPLRPPPDWRHV